MQNTQEYLSENSQRNYPFRASINGVSPAVPKGFILTLRLFITGDQETTAWLSEIKYTQTTDIYKLTFSNASGIILDGEISRLDSGSSRNTKKSVIGSGQKVCIFTTGDLWDSPSWNGGGNWTITITEAGGLIEPTCLLPGPATLRRIIIDGIADPGNYPKNAIQSIQGGHNVSLSLSNNLYLIENDGSITIEAGAGLGLGLVPAREDPEEEQPKIPITTINNIGPDSVGNVNLQTADCLRAVIPISQGMQIENTIQIQNDCVPCCQCSSFRAFARSTKRRAEEIQLLCQSVRAQYKDSIDMYDIGIKESKNKKKNKPLVIVRDVRLDKNTITFTVQNISQLTVYPYISISVSDIYGDGIYFNEPMTVISPLSFTTISRNIADQKIIIIANKTTRAKDKDEPGTEDSSLAYPTNIDDNIGNGIILQCNYPHKDNFQSGDSCAAYIDTAGIDLRTEGNVIMINTVAALKKDLKFGSLGHSISMQVVVSDNKPTLTILDEVPIKES